MAVQTATNGASLAKKLGETAHVSPLLRRVRHVSGCAEDKVGDWLLKSAIERGAVHYQREFSDQLPPDNPVLSEEEIGVALCLGELTYEAARIRAAAQLLSSPHVNAPRLVRLAVMERVEPVLLHIAHVAARFAPELEPWVYLREHLSSRRSVSAGVLPHWSRFVSQTGVTAFNGGPRIDWLPRREFGR